MPSDLRSTPKALQVDGRSQEPLLGDNGSLSPKAYSPPVLSRRSTFRGRDSDEMAAIATRKRYAYAAFFLFLSLISFCVQTETAVYIQSQLGWKKPYCML
jgi:hypothetical protein